jgi:hypothetical protein
VQENTKQENQQKKNQETIEVESRNSQANDINWGKCNGKGLLVTLVALFLLLVGLSLAIALL